METLRYPTPKALMEDACNAIREKDGTAEKIPHQDVPDRIRAIQSGPGVDLSQITTKAENVLETERYMGSDGQMHSGTMPEIADDTVTLDGNIPEHDIQEGHHTGGGKVKIVPDLNNIFTPTKQQQSLSPADGKVFTKIILEPIPDIYVDKTGANALAENVLQGMKFIGATGEISEGTMPVNEPPPEYTEELPGYMWGHTVKKGYNPKEYRVVATYEQEVNVTQEVDNSKNDNAVAANVRMYNDAGQIVSFRAGGEKRYGSMRDVELPEIELTASVEESNKRIVFTATMPGIEEGGYLPYYIPRPKSAYLPICTDHKDIYPSTGKQVLEVENTVMANNITIHPMTAYGDADGEKWTWTPTGIDQTIPTAGKYLAQNITIKAGTGVNWKYFVRNGIDSESLQIPASEITGKPVELYITRTSQPTDGSAWTVEYLYIMFNVEKAYHVRGMVIRNGVSGNSAYIYDSTYPNAEEYFSVEYSSFDGIVVSVNQPERSDWFDGDYNLTLILEV